jgi:hypothetical protein
MRILSKIQNNVSKTTSKAVRTYKDIPEGFQN